MAQWPPPSTRPCLRALFPKSITLFPSTRNFEQSLRGGGTGENFGEVAILSFQKGSWTSHSENMRSRASGAGLEIKHVTSGARLTRSHWKSGSPFRNLRVTQMYIKLNEKIMEMFLQIWPIILDFRSTSLTFLYCLTSVLSKKWSIKFVSCVVHELPLLLLGVTRTPCQSKSRSPAKNLGAADSRTPPNFEPCFGRYVILTIQCAFIVKIW